MTLSPNSLPACEGMTVSPSSNLLQGSLATKPPRCLRLSSEDIKAACSEANIDKGIPLSLSLFPGPRSLLGTKHSYVGRTQIKMSQVFAQNQHSPRGGVGE